MSYIFAGLHNGTIHKYLDTDLSNDGQASYGAQVRALAVDGDYLYAVGYSSSASQRIIRYNVSDMSSAGQSPLLNTAYALTVHDDYIYSGGLVLTTSRPIRRYNLSNLSSAGQSPDYGGIVRAVAIHGDYAYAAGDTTRTIRRYNLSNLSYVDESPSYGGNINALVVHGDYIYAAGVTTQTIRRYNLSDLSYVDESPSYGGTINTLAIHGDYIYAAGDGSYRIRRYNLSNLSYVGQSGSYNATLHALIVHGDYIYAAGAYVTGQSFGTVRRYNLSNLSSAGESPRVYQTIYSLAVYDPAVIEWREMSSTETIPVTTEYADDPTMYPGTTRTVEGTAGVLTHTWEEEFVDDVSSGNKRNEVSTVTTPMVPTVVYTGTGIVTWDPRESFATIPLTIEYEDDPDMYPGTTRTVEGNDGQSKTTWEAEQLNGVDTGDTRNHETVTVIEMVPTIIYTGTGIVTWVERESFADVPVTTVNEDDPDMYPGTTRTVEGSSGQTKTTWEAEQLNGDDTGETRNHETVTVIEMVPTIIYTGTGIVTWVERESYDTIPITTEYEDDPDMYVGDTRTVEGSAGQTKTTWEAEQLNGVYTGETRSYSTVTTIEMVPTIIYQGTKPIPVEEWRSMTETEVSPKTTEYEDDPEMYPDTTRTVEGTDGEITHTWEEFFLDGVSTGQRRNEQSEVTIEMVPTIIYTGTGIVTWVEQESKEVVPRTTEEHDDPDMIVGETRTVEGVDGEITHTWEAEFLNGVATGEVRDEQSTVTIVMVPTKIYHGTKVVEWRPMSSEEIIEVATEYEDDPEMYPDTTRTVEGSAGVITHTWEEYFENDVSTGLKRNEQSEVTTPMVPTVIYTGTGIVTWVEREAIDEIPVTTRTEPDNTMFVGETRTVDGTPGELKRTWEAELLNDVETGMIRNAAETVLVEMVQTVVYEGTKVREWIPKSRIEPIEIATEYRDDPDLQMGHTRIEHGVEGVTTYTWEAEYVDGVPTGVIRNEQSEITTPMQPTIHYIGTRPVSWAEWLAEGRPVIPVVTVIDGGDIVCTIDGEYDIIEGSMYFERAASSGSGYRPGYVEASEMGFTIINDTNKFDGIAFEGKELMVQLKVAEETLPYGRFIVDTKPIIGRTIEIRALDYIARLSRPLTVSVNGKTIGLALSDVLASCGLQLASNTFTNSNRVLGNYSDLQDATSHEMVQWLVALSGGIGYMSLETNPRFVIAEISNSSPARQIPDLNVLDEKNVGFENEFSGVTAKVGEQEYLVGNEIKSVMQIEDNPLLSSSMNHQAILSGLGNRIIGSKVISAPTLSTLSEPFILPLEKVKYTDVNDKEVVTYVLTHRYNLNAGSKMTADWSLDPTTGYASMSPISPAHRIKIREAVQQAAEANISAYEAGLLELNSRMANALGYYVTEREFPDGSKLTYTHDQPTLEASSYISFQSAQGFAFTNSGWNNGNPVWTYGVMNEGSLIMRMISTVGLNADWINSGTIDSGIIRVGNTPLNSTLSVYDGKTTLLTGSGIYTGDVEANRVKITGSTRLDSKISDYDGKTTLLTSSGIYTGTLEADKVMVTSSLTLDSKLSEHDGKTTQLTPTGIYTGTLSADKVVLSNNVPLETKLGQQDSAITDIEAGKITLSSQTNGLFAGLTLTSSSLTYSTSTSYRQLTGWPTTDFLRAGTSETNLNFRVTNKGVLHATGAVISGTIEVGSTLNGSLGNISGSIAGLTLSSSSLTYTSSTSYRQLSGYPTADFLRAGSSSDDLNFRVTARGVLHATGAIISGNVTATTGDIGNWTIQNGHLRSTNGSQGIQLSGVAGSTPILVGDSNFANAKFRVGWDGSLYAESATIKGTIQAGSIINGQLNSTTGTHTGTMTGTLSDTTGTHTGTMTGTLSNTSGTHTGNINSGGTFKGAASGVTGSFGSVTGTRWNGAVTGSHTGNTYSSTGTLGGVGYSQYASGSMFLGGRVRPYSIIATSPTSSNAIYGDLTLYGGFTNNSDIHYKHDVRPINKQPIVDGIYSLELVNFEMKDREGDRFGIIANDVLSKLPSEFSKYTIFPSEDGYLTASYQTMSMMGIAAIQDLNERLKAVEEKLA